MPDKKRSLYPLPAEKEEGEREKNKTPNFKSRQYTTAQFVDEFVFPPYIVCFFNLRVITSYNFHILAQIERFGISSECWRTPYQILYSISYPSEIQLIYLFIYLNIFNQDNLISNAVFHQGPEKHSKIT